MRLISKLLLACLLGLSGASFGAFSGGSGGSGTVTTFSCVTANGVSCSVANATTTPAATFTLGAITPTTVNGHTFTTGSSTFTGTAGQTYTFPTTSATLARTDAANTFTGTQTIGALVATTVNGNTFTTGTGVLTIAAGKTLTQNNSIVHAGTDGTTMTYPTTSATLARTDAANTFTGSQTFSSLTATGIVYAGTAGLLTTDATNFLYDATNFRVQIGSGATISAGFLLGYRAVSGFNAMWGTHAAPSGTNYFLSTDTNNLYLNGPVSSINLGVGNVYKFSMASTAGAGPVLAVGTAASAVSALSVTQTWNFNTSAITGVKFTFTDTSSHANTLAMQILCGASGTTNCFSVDKSGGMRTGGTVVGSLPAAGVAGRHMYVTDQLTACVAPGVAITGGGGVTCPVFDNGSAWVGL